MLSTERSRGAEVAIALAACSAAWVIGSTLLFASGGLNVAGLVPSIGALIALWGAIRLERGLMMAGTVVVAVSSVSFIFSLGFIVIPAAIALIISTFLIFSAHQPTG